ncbi:MAG: 3-deoxy-7-phosphoheptulonate synthase [Deferribacterota bacterium]|nr:3-deoxy-7-phosphoheptulonate synthase [Deferribacterota bacterium]
MVIVLKSTATEDQKNRIIGKLKDYGFKVHISEGVEKTIIGAIGDERVLENKPLSSLEGVEKVIPILKPYKIVSRDFKKEDAIVEVGNVKFGPPYINVIAGPCSVESEEMIFAIAEKVANSGAKLLRGGAYKPRTSPYSFQGLGVEGLKYMRKAADAYNLYVVTELMDPRNLDILLEYADMIQIGARNMQNFKLLSDVGKSKKPVLLKRGLCSTIKEFLMAAEYIANEGNYNIVLCERGLRSFDPETRNLLDLSAIPVIKQNSYLPVIVDPSHGTGRRDCIEPMSLASIAAGADGLIIEVHTNPDEALSDGDQSIRPTEFANITKKIGEISKILGKQFEY